MNKVLSYKIKEVNVFLTLLVVLLHCLPNTNEPLVYRTIGSFCDIAVPCFFTISAFLYFYNWKPTRMCYWNKLKTRFHSLFIPYIIFNVILWGYYSLTVQMGLFPGKSMPSRELCGFFMYLYESVGDPPLWYLRSLFCFVLCAPLFFLVIRLAGIWALVAIVPVSFGVYLTPYASMIYWLPCILFGAYFAIRKDEMKYIIKKIVEMPMPLWNIVFVVSVTLIILFNVKTFHREANLFYYCYRIISVILVLIFMCKRNILPRNIVKLLSPISFFIYCAHFPVKEMIWGIFHKNGGGNFIIVYLLTMLTLIAMSFVLRKVDCLWNLLIGKRKI